MFYSVNSVLWQRNDDGIQPLLARCEAVDSFTCKVRVNVVMFAKLCSGGLNCELVMSSLTIISLV